MKNLKQRSLSPLMALLMLDFSGSMDQVVAKEPKQLVVKESLTQYLESLPEQSKVEMTVFGTNPKKGCSDFTKKSLSPSEAKKWVGELKPGVFGKTPLAEGIRQMSVLVRKFGHRNAIIVTDGADTCGQDACAELEKLDDLMKDMVGKLRLDVIGFDTQSDERFQCLKKLPQSLGRVEMALHDINSRPGLMKALIQNQAQEKIKPGMAGVMVQGSPTEAKFFLKPVSEGDHKEWSGEFKVQIKPGKYLIRTNQSDAQEIAFEVFTGDVRMIPYGDFFKQKTGLVILETEGLELDFAPLPETVRAHPTVQPLKDIGSAQNIELLFGSWTLTVKGPWWLNGVASRDIRVERNKQMALNMKEFFRDQITWEDTSKMVEPGVFGIDKEKVLVMPGTKHVPYKKGWRAEWLTAQ